MISILRTRPIGAVGIEWRSDYDPLRGQVVNSSFSVDVRYGDYFLSAGHAPKSNQFRGALGFGNPNHRGWNAAFTTIYDFRIGAMQFATTQVT